jgi:hypothetical protein
MTRTFKFTLMAATAAVIALGSASAQATNMEHDDTVTTTRITTYTQTQEKSADIPGPQDSKAESEVWYESPNGGLLKVDRNFAMFDDNRNGQISSYEFKKHIGETSPTTFESVDTDKNGLLTESEFNAVILEQTTISETFVSETTEILPKE